MRVKITRQGISIHSQMTLQAMEKALSVLGSAKNNSTKNIMKKKSGNRQKYRKRFIETSIQNYTIF